MRHVCMSPSEKIFGLNHDIEPFLNSRNRATYRPRLSTLKLRVGGLTRVPLHRKTCPAAKQRIFGWSWGTWRKRALECFDAQIWAHAWSWPFVGIYGPNRNALATLRDRKAGNINDSKLVSRIHVGDLCRGIHASMTSSIAARKRVYNMADDLPASREEVFSYAKRLGSFSEGDTDLSTRTRRDKSRSSKRVNNARLRNELITDLVYPSYVEGLKDLENQCIWPFTESILQLSANRTS